MINYGLYHKFAEIALKELLRAQKTTMFAVNPAQMAIQSWDIADTMMDEYWNRSNKQMQSVIKEDLDGLIPGQH